VRITASSARTSVVVAIVLVAIAAIAFAGRRATIAAFFPDGAPGPVPALTRTAEAAREPPAARVRVVLLDGLGRDAAMQQPELSALCARGLDLALDTGFPTVSLPVQHALWTGRTQQQSGVMHRVAQSDHAPTDALPARVPDSVAVAESHPEIVHSFGFARVVPDVPFEDSASWREEGFIAAAHDAIASVGRLAFVHVLVVDETGHAHGAASPEYAAAAARADAWLGELVRADPDPATTRWFVLADHGHRARGGHGDAEPEIRIVRACIVGGVEPGTGELHLVDFHRAMVDALGLVPTTDASGRPLAFALRHPDPEATLPRPGPTRWGAALALVLAAAVATARAAGRRWWAWPLWWPIAYVTVVLVYGAITLSNPVVYPPLGSSVLFGAVPALAVLAVVLVRGAGLGIQRIAIAQLALPIALALAPAVLCGALDLLAGRRVPPLVPIWTAHASVDATLVVAGCATCAVVLAIVSWRRAAGPSAAHPASSA
jgi:hypothetical protein